MFAGKKWKYSPPTENVITANTRLDGEKVNEHIEKMHFLFSNLFFMYGQVFATFHIANVKKKKKTIKAMLDVLARGEEIISGDFCPLSSFSLNASQLIASTRGQLRDLFSFYVVVVVSDWWLVHHINWGAFDTHPLTCTVFFRPFITSGSLAMCSSIKCRNLSKTLFLNLLK